MLLLQFLSCFSALLIPHRFSGEESASSVLVIPNRLGGEESAFLAGVQY
jgi:hypothetical protein